MGEDLRPQRHPVDGPSFPILPSLPEIFAYKDEGKNKKQKTKKNLSQSAPPGSAKKKKKMKAKKTHYVERKL